MCQSQTPILRSLVLPRSQSFILQLKRVILLVIISVLLFQNGSHAQIGLGGVQAIMTVPTARIQKDGYLAVGFGYIPRPYAMLAERCCDDLPYFATLGFLPFLEVSLRATLALHHDLPGIGDRMASVRAQLFKESRHRPALAVGLHDFVAVQSLKPKFHALYAVVTKTVFTSTLFNVETTIGKGFDWFNALHYEFNGLFGGANLCYRRLLSIKGEYDAKKFNFGFGLQAKGFLTINLVLLDGRKLAFGANFQTRL